jgi:hypothetical protein
MDSTKNSTKQLVLEQMYYYQARYCRRKSEKPFLIGDILKITDDIMGIFFMWPNIGKGE